MANTRIHLRTLRGLESDSGSIEIRLLIVRKEWTADCKDFRERRRLHSVQIRPGLEICIQAFAEEPGVYLGCDIDHGAGDWCEHSDFQRGARGAAGTSAIPRSGPAGATVACATAIELSRDDAICGVRGKLSGLAEAERCVQRDGAL